jgi:hypothetical protein
MDYIFKFLTINYLPLCFKLFWNYKEFTNNKQQISLLKAF